MQRKARKYPDFFPGSVKHIIIPEMHSVYFAMACIQRSLEMIPEAEHPFENIITQLDTTGCQKLEKKRLFDKALSSYAQRKSHPLLRLLPRILLLLPSFLLNRDFRKLYILIQDFILNVFNRDADNPKTLGSHWLRLGILQYARFCHAGIGPYEFDEKHRPLSAQVALIRPKTEQGRKAKLIYDEYMRKYKKHPDKYYKNGARKWLLARVICKGVTEAEKVLNMDPGQLHKDLYQEPWDKVMGYQKG
jgi:hypothetical protein